LKYKSLISPFSNFYYFPLPEDVNKIFHNSYILAKSKLDIGLEI